VVESTYYTTPSGQCQGLLKGNRKLLRINIFWWSISNWSNVHLYQSRSRRWVRGLYI